MDELINLQSFKNSSAKAQLKELYMSIDSTSMDESYSFIERTQFLRRKYGQFIKIVRMRKGLSKAFLGKLLGTDVYGVNALEVGKVSIRGNVMFLICNVLDANCDLYIFLEKIDESLNFEIRRNRSFLVESQKICNTARSEQLEYRTRKVGKLINFKKVER